MGALKWKKKPTPKSLRKLILEPESSTVPRPSGPMNAWERLEQIVLGYCLQWQLFQQQRS